MKKILSQEEARRLLDTPKKVVEKEEFKSSFEIDLAKANDFRILLSTLDSIDNAPKFLLRIRVSDKLRTKVSLHTQDNESSFCLFRVDFNGTTHTNPSEVNQYLPEKFKPYVGEIIQPNHIHYHVQGYVSAAWAIPIEADDFPVTSIGLDDYYNQLKEIVAAVSSVIHLETKLIITGNLIYDGMD